MRLLRWPAAIALAVVLGGISLLCLPRGHAEEAAGKAEQYRALAIRAEAAIEKAGMSPGREYANRLRGDWYPAWLKFFRGEREQPKDDRKSENVARDITQLTELAEAGPTWPLPAPVIVPKAGMRIKLDGKLDEKCWQKAVTFTDIYPFDEKKAGGPKTTWKMLWDDRNLYFAFDCADTDICAPRRPRDAEIYSDDCVEMFILPEFRFRTYWEIIISPAGDIFDSVECKAVDRWGLNLDPSQTVEGMGIGIDLRGTLNKSDDVDDGYTVEVAVPFNQLPGYALAKPKAGQQLHFMLVRLDRTQGQFTPYAYTPLLGWGHNIWNQAVMTLGK